LAVGKRQVVSRDFESGYASPTVHLFDANQSGTIRRIGQEAGVAGLGYAAAVDELAVCPQGKAVDARLVDLIVVIGTEEEVMRGATTRRPGG
jgi:hypothetical protein